MENIITSEFGYCDWSVESETEIDEEGNEIESDDYVHIENLYIHPNYRHMGKGRELLSTAIKLIEDSYPGLEIKIVPVPKATGIDMVRLADFYETFGITVVCV